MKGRDKILKEMNAYLTEFNTWYKHMTQLSDFFWKWIHRNKWEKANLTVLTFDDIVAINYFQSEAMKILEYVVAYDKWWKENDIEGQFFANNLQIERHNRLLELAYSMYNNIEEVVKGGNNKLVVEEYPFDYVTPEEFKEFGALINKEVDLVMYML